MILLLQSEKQNEYRVNIISSEYYPIIINPRNQLSSLEQTKKKRKKKTNQQPLKLATFVPSLVSILLIFLHMSREREKERSLKEHRKAKKSEKGRNTLRKRRPQAFTFQRGENSSATKSERVAFFLTNSTSRSTNPDAIRRP